MADGTTLNMVLFQVSCVDGYMNIALEKTENYVNGRVLNRHGDAFIRGRNGEYMHDYSRFARF